MSSGFKCGRHGRKRRSHAPIEEGVCTLVFFADGTVYENGHYWLESDRDSDGMLPENGYSGMDFWRDMLELAQGWEWHTCHGKCASFFCVSGSWPSVTLCLHSTKV